MDICLTMGIGYISVVGSWTHIVDVGVIMGVVIGGCGCGYLRT